MLNLAGSALGLVVRCGAGSMCAGCSACMVFVRNFTTFCYNLAENLKLVEKMENIILESRSS